MTDLTERARAWAAEDPDPRPAPSSSGVIAPAGDDRADLADRFDGTLEFGTAGLRGGSAPARTG